MRDINRIPKVLKVIEKCWELVPDWRLGQFIENFKRMINCSDLFYYEDDKLVEELSKIFRLDELEK